MLQIGHRHLICKEVEIVWGLHEVLHCVCGGGGNALGGGGFAGLITPSLFIHAVTEQH